MIKTIFALLLGFLVACCVIGIAILGGSQADVGYAPYEDVGADSIDTGYGDYDTVDTYIQLERSLIASEKRVHSP